MAESYGGGGGYRVKYGSNGERVVLLQPDPDPTPEESKHVPSQEPEPPIPPSKSAQESSIPESPIPPMPEQTPEEQPAMPETSTSENVKDFQGGIFRRLKERGERKHREYVNRLKEEVEAAITEKSDSLRGDASNFHATRIEKLIQREEGLRLSPDDEAYVKEVTSELLARIAELSSEEQSYFSNRMEVLARAQGYEGEGRRAEDPDFETEYQADLKAIKNPNSYFTDEERHRLVELDNQKYILEKRLEELQGPVPGMTSPDIEETQGKLEEIASERERMVERARSYARKAERLYKLQDSEMKASETAKERDALEGFSEEDMRESYLEHRLKKTRDEYARHIAAGLDNTFTITAGRKKHREEALKAYLTAQGIAHQWEMEEKNVDPAEGERKAREATLNKLLGDPDVDGDEGELGRMEQAIAKQQNLNSGFYEENKATGELERNGKGEIREVLGKKWNQWSKEGWKGKAKQATAMAIGGFALTTLAGALGTGVAGAGAIAITARLAAWGARSRLNKTATQTRADEDARERMERAKSKINREGDAYNALFTASTESFFAADKEHKKKVRMVGAMGVAAVMGSTFAHMVANGAEDTLGAVGRMARKVGGVFGDHSSGLHSTESHPSVHPSSAITHPSPEVTPTGHHPSGETGRPGHVGGGSHAPIPDTPHPTHGTHEITSSEIKPTIDETYRANGMDAQDYIRHAGRGIRGGELRRVSLPNGNFYYDVTEKGMQKYGLKGASDSTNNVLKVLQAHSKGDFSLAA